MPEQFVNAGYSTLNGAIVATVTTFTLNSLPAAVQALTSGQIRAIFGDDTGEIVIIPLPITGLVPASVTRGAEGTTASAHNDMCPVVFQLTAGQCNQFAQVTGGQLAGTGQAPTVVGLTEALGTQLPIDVIQEGVTLARLGGKIKGTQSLDDLYRKFRLLLQAYILAGLPPPQGMDDEIAQALNQQ